MIISKEELIIMKGQIEKLKEAVQVIDDELGKDNIAYSILNNHLISKIAYIEHHEHEED